MCGREREAADGVTKHSPAGAERALATYSRAPLLLRDRRGARQAREHGVHVDG